MKTLQLLGNFVPQALDEPLSPEILDSLVAAIV